MEDVIITRSCPKVDALRRLDEWCDMAGHWRVMKHHLDRRRIPETVLIYCVAGRGWLRLDGRTHIIVEGNLFCCPALEPHAYGCDPGRGWDIWWLHFGGGRGMRLCHEAGMSKRSPVLDLGLNRDMIQHFASLVDCLGKTNQEIPWCAAERLHGILLCLIKGAAMKDEVGEGSFWDLVHDHWISLDEMAKAAGYSKYHFSRLFREQTGMSPWKAVLERKMERAKELLIGGDMSVKEVAAFLGFENADYFAKLFRRHAGINPGRYRGNRKVDPGQQTTTFAVN